MTKKRLEHTKGVGCQAHLTNSEPRPPGGQVQEVNPQPSWCGHCTNETLMHGHGKLGAI